MDINEIKFCQNIIKRYLGICDVEAVASQNINEFQQKNVKFHTQDKKWLKSFICSCAYKEFSPSSQQVCNIRQYLNSDEFDALIKNYENYVIDTYTKQILKDLKKDSLKNIEPQRRAGVVCELIVSHLQKKVNIPRDVSLPRILKRQNDFVLIIKKIMKNETLAQSMIEKY